MYSVKSHFFAFFGALIWLGLVVTPVSAQSQPAEVSAIVERLAALEREIRDLQLATYQSSGETTSSGVYDPSSGTIQGSSSVATSGDPTLSRVLVRLDQLEREIRTLTGQIEEMNFKIQQANQEIESLSKDTDFRLRAIESGGAVPPAQRPAETQTSPSTFPKTQIESGPQSITSVPGDFQSEYKSAFSLLKSSEFEQAEKSFQQFLAEHGDTELASNAQYWLGETYYHRNMHREGATAFLDCVRKYPDGKKAPDCMLKLGMSLAALDKKQEACSTFAEVPRRYPSASNNIKSKAQEEHGRLSCS